MSKGFTLLETLVAISVLALALAGILSLASLGVHASSGASNQVKAFFLASEAVEYIRNRRDSNIIAGSDWLSGLGGCGSGCVIDVYAGTISSCDPFCPKVKFDSSANIFGHTSGEDSVFTRKATITQTSDDEIKLAVEVSWTQGSLARSFVLEERLFNLAF